jgi:hypothetical protein
MGGSGLENGDRLRGCFKGIKSAALSPQFPILGDLESQNPPIWGAVRATILTFQTPLSHSSRFSQID